MRRADLYRLEQELCGTASGLELQPGARLQSRQVTTEVLAPEFLTLIRFTGAGSKDT